MLGLQAHRGPDAHGQWVTAEESIGICHNRLSIVDLTEAGNQPMISADGHLVVVFNGEIYNHRELRRELEAKGVAFKTHSDTEVLMEAYRFWNEAMLPRLRGMFAFAIFDQRNKELFCARDRIGKKPFVYAQTASAFVFASEIPAVLRVPGIDATYDHSAIAAMLLHNLRHIPDPHTAYRGIKRLRAGHAMKVKEGRIERTWRYWTPSRAEGENSAARLRQILEEAVDLRMQADVPVGALLSGGVDSSAIVALMQKRTRDPVNTYALGFDENDEDLVRARQMSALVGTRHREFYFDPSEQWDIFRRLIGIYGEPIMLLPLTYTYALCRAIRDDGIKVVLSGNGADELFYGYTGHVRTAWISTFLRAAGPAARLTGFGKADSPLRALLAASAGERKAAFYRSCEKSGWGTVVNAGARDGLNNLVADELAYWGKLCPSRALIDESNFCALMVENTHSVTIASDLPPMLASVEMRAPFLDQEIVDFALATPVRKKVPWIAPANRLKWILRQAVQDLVPHSLLFAPKRGFGSGIPQDEVLRGPWAKQGDALFASPHDCDGLFDPTALREAWRVFKERGSEGSNVVPNMFAIQYWLQFEGIPK